MILALLALQIAVVPRPAEVRMLAGTYELPRAPAIIVQGPHLVDAAELLRQLLREVGVEANIRGGLPMRGAIILEAPRTAAADSEAYDLIVRPDGVRMRAGSATGIVWAIQTFRQLLPPSGLLRPQASGLRLNAVEIHDRPRFRWRGAMLDVARHFYPLDDVKRFIDLMSRYKLNVFHWHLTEDQGWRLEIRRWPRLTEVGAWRTEPDGSRHGGWYTQAEAREVVRYAASRGIAVVPEIEMPGHASAAVASYPSLGCADTTITVPNSWGVFPHVFCVERPEVLRFLDEVLDEVVAIFPARYLHVGGDEAPVIPDSVQSAFTRRMALALRSRGRRLIGWDEITEGGAPEGVTIQVWRDMAHADSAARRGFDVIASPESHVYINRSPADLPLERVYAFDPMPPGLPRNAQRHILGGEAPLWSEHIDGANLDLMAFPRLLALSEALWTTGTRSFDEFRVRLGDHYARLRALGVTPGPEERTVLRMPVRLDSATGGARIALERGVDELIVRYSRDTIGPTAQSPAYDTSIVFDSGVVRLRGFVRDRPTLYQRQLVFDRHLARGRPITLATPPRPRYPGTGPRSLTDGLIGSADFDDGLWQGFIRAGLDAVIDLGEAREINEITGSFLQNTRSWILLPAAMEVFDSDDGTTWRSLGSIRHEIPAEMLDPFTFRLSLQLLTPVRARYLRVTTPPGAPLPAWHGGAGNPSWVFADEIIVR